MNVKYFFKQTDHKSCGICVLNTIFEMYGKQRKIFSVGKKGTSPKKILCELRKEGINAVRKDIGIRNIATLKYRLKPRSIIYYPPNHHNGKRGDHYVVIERIRGEKAFVYDSKEEGPLWLSLFVLQKRWERKNRKGWVIETRA